MWYCQGTRAHAWCRPGCSTSSMNFLLFSTTALLAFSTFALASEFERAKKIIVGRFLEAYEGCLTGNHPVEFSITSKLPPFGSPKNCPEFIITTADVTGNYKLHFTFRIFAGQPDEVYLRPSEIPLDEKVVKFFANEWQGVKEDLEPLNPFSKESKLFEIKILGDQTVWVSLNFNYKQFGKYLESSKLEARRFIHDVFKNPTSESYSDLKTAREVIFSAPVEVEAQEESLVSSITSAVRTRIDYPLENMFKPFFEKFKDVKIQDIGSLCNFNSDIDRGMFTRDSFEIAPKASGGIELPSEEFFSDKTFEEIYGTILQGFSVCSHGFSGLNCPALSWIAPHLPLFKRVVKVGDIYVCISGLHGASWDDSKSLDFLMDHTKEYSFMVIKVTTTNKDYMYGSGPTYKNEFRIYFIKE